MLSNSSWDRHRRRKDNVIDLDAEDIEIYAFKDNNEWQGIEDTVLLYDAVEKGNSSCKRSAGDE